MSKMTLLRDAMLERISFIDEKAKDNGDPFESGRRAELTSAIEVITQIIEKTSKTPGLHSLKVENRDDAIKLLDCLIEQSDDFCVLALQKLRDAIKLGFV